MGCSQAETYRRMKKATKNSWEASTPVTNCLWIRYLTDILLAEKTHTISSVEEKVELRSFRKRTMGYSSCRDMLWDEFFKGLWAAQT